MCQPGLERPGDRADLRAERAQLVGQLRLAHADHAEQQVRVPAQQLGRAGHGEVGAERERLHPQRGGERVVDREPRAGRVRRLGDRAQVAGAQPGVRGRLDPQQRRVLRRPRRARRCRSRRSARGRRPAAAAGRRACGCRDSRRRSPRGGRPAAAAGSPRRPRPSPTRRPRPGRRRARRARARTPSRSGSGRARSRTPRRPWRRAGGTARRAPGRRAAARPARRAAARRAPRGCSDRTPLRAARWRVGLSWIDQILREVVAHEVQASVAGHGGRVRRVVRRPGWHERRGGELCPQRGQGGRQERRQVVAVAQEGGRQARRRLLGRRVQGPDRQQASRRGAARPPVRAVPRGVRQRRVRAGAARRHRQGGNA